MSQKTRSTFVLVHPTEILDALVGLKDVRVVRYERRGPHVELMVEQVPGEVLCPTCHRRAEVKERPVVHYVDLPVYGTPMSLAWKKHRMRCVDPACATKSWVLTDHRIAAKHCLLTTRAAKWATVQVGGGRTVSEVAAELACDWHTVNDAVTTYGKALLEADRKRLNQTTAIGLDETSFVKLGTKSHADFVTTVADVENHQIIDILPTRKYADVAGWIDKQPEAWKERIRYRRPRHVGHLRRGVHGRLAQSLPGGRPVPCHLPGQPLPRRRAAPGADPNSSATGVDRDDPLYRARRVLLMGEEKLDEDATARLASLLELGDPNAEVAIAYRIKERFRDFYRTSDPDEARQLLEELQAHCLKRAMPPEVQKLGRTIRQWFDKLCNYHLAKVTNGPTESLNNLIKRIKRIGFGFRNFENYRIRALLYAGRPNWRVLGSIVVR